MYRNTSARPFVTVTPKLITFSRLAAHDLGEAEYVHVFFNAERKSFAVQACDPDVDAIPFVRRGGSRRQSAARWGDGSIVAPIVEMMDEKLFERGSVRVVGQTYPDERLIVFDVRDVVLAPRKRG